jgi:hypothetical protein
MFNLIIEPKLLSIDMDELNKVKIYTIKQITYLEVITKQPRTIGLELAWGRNPIEVRCIFFIFLIFAFIFCIYLIISILKT